MSPDRDELPDWRFAASFRLGRHWQEIGDFVRAHAAYLEAKARSHGRHRPTLYNLAVVAIRLGLYDEAEARLKELADLEELPENPTQDGPRTRSLYPIAYQRALIEEYRGNYRAARKWSEPLARDALAAHELVPPTLRLPALTLHTGVLVELDKDGSTPGDAAEAILEPNDVPRPTTVKEAAPLAAYIEREAGEDRRTRYNLACLCSRLVELVPSRAEELAAHAAQEAAPALQDTHLAAWAELDPSLTQVRGTAEWEQAVEQAAVPEPAADSGGAPSAMPPSPHIRLREQIERERTVDRAVTLLTDVRADDTAPAVLDGVQRVRERAASVSSRRFEIELASAVAVAGDPGTAYRLPSTSAPATMALPFSVEETFDDRGARRFIIVSSDDSPLSGSEITHWNDVPMERAVALRAAHIAAATADARRARALATLTYRPARWLASFDEGDVTVRYRSNDRPEKHSFGWERSEPQSSPAGGPFPWSLDPLVDAITAQRQDDQVRGGPIGPAARPVFHLRVPNFVADADALAAAVHNALGDAAGRLAVVLDLRRNPGGSVLAALRLFELMCGVRVEPKVELRTTKAAEDVVRGFAGKWADAMAKARAEGRPRVDVTLELKGAVPPPVAKRVVLLVDALCGGAAAVVAQHFADRGVTIVSTVGEPAGPGGLTVMPAGDAGGQLGDFSVTFGRVAGPRRVLRPDHVVPPSLGSDDAPLDAAAELASSSTPRGGDG